MLCIRSFALCVSLAATTLLASLGQQKSAAHEPDLRKFTSRQLIACYEDSQTCGTKDVYPIQDELKTRLKTLTSGQLLECFADFKVCGVGEGQASGWGISDELARRGDIRPILLRYSTERDREIRDGIEHVAYHFPNDPEAISLMQQIVTGKIDDGEDRYWPVNYLAKMCDPIALNELGRVNTISVMIVANGDHGGAV